VLIDLSWAEHLKLQKSGMDGDWLDVMHTFQQKMLLFEMKINELMIRLREKEMT